MVPGDLRDRLSVIIPAVDEVHSLRQTVHEVLARCGYHVHEVIVVLCHRSTVACREEVRRLVDEYSGIVRLHEQRHGRLGGAFREAIETATGKSFISTSRPASRNAAE